MLIWAFARVENLLASDDLVRKALALFVLALQRRIPLLARVAAPLNRGELLIIGSALFASTPTLRVLLEAGFSHFLRREC